MKKAFTLLELLAVIVILGILVVLAVPKVTDIIETAKMKTYKSNEEVVIKSAKNYLTFNEELLPKEIGETTEITFEQLQNEKYMNQITDSEGVCDGYILVTKTEEDYEYIPHVKCGESNTISSSTEDGLIVHYTFDDFQEGTENLWDGILYEYNNHSIPTIFTKTGESYKGGEIYRLEMTPNTPEQIDNIRKYHWNHGVRIASISYLANKPYTKTIYWKAINKNDITVEGEVSNIGGWIQEQDEILENGWRRSVTKRDGTVTTTKTDNSYWAFKCPSIELGETIIIEWACPQVEQKDHQTNYTFGTRDSIIQDYSKNNNNGIINGTTKNPNEYFYNFDGIDDYIEANISKLENYTITSWFNKQEGNNYLYGWVGIVGWKFATEALEGIIIVEDETIRYRDYLGEGSIIKTNFLAKNNNWYSVSYTNQGDNLKIYLDKKLIINANQNSSLETSSIFQIGAIKWQTGQNRAFKGSIGETKIYNRALSEEEIKYDYDMNKYKYE